MAPIGVALIGGGIFVKNEHLIPPQAYVAARTDDELPQPAVLKCDKLSLKAIFSRSLKSAQETANLVPDNATVDLYSADSGDDNTFHDLLLRRDIAAVIVALPITVQQQYIESALAAGKHVLAEKPLSPDVSIAQKLMAYAADATCRNGGTLSIAENYRFHENLVYAQEHARTLGKLKQFNLQGSLPLSKDSPYFNTYWRANPEFQGGFVLDAGIHFAAGARLFLQGDAAPETVRAFTSRISDHLMPIDTAHAIVRLRSGASASFAISLGSKFSPFTEYRIEYDRGTIHIADTTVTIKTDGQQQEIIQEITSTSGVANEVEAWATGLVQGQPDPRQSVDLALGDLEFMEAIIKSAAQDGQGQRLEFQ
ncbi:hypothetical protein E4U43_003042 [Claviceps pusilla]|uniref:Gfo/Idh/MocA-like oxidoreductase N-terminal domain-containing protein n=1 Tax=Claviceps pusilla TaxID=123648 RepID=A0A9P7SZJ5_9HYPO|nr:hypothetical protein E4U43_003042 [Claviceps pusilla]